MRGLIAGAVALLFSVPLIVGVLAGGFAAEDEEMNQVAWGGVLTPGTIPNGWDVYVLQAGAMCPEFTPNIIAAQIEAESNWNPNARSPVGAVGLAQFMPATWAAYGTDGNADGLADPLEPADAIVSMGVYNCAVIDILRQGGMSPTTELGLAAYNAGPGAVLAFNGIPPYPETQAYVPKIMERAGYYGSGGGGAPALDAYLPAPEVCPRQPGGIGWELNLRPDTLRVMHCALGVHPWTTVTSAYRSSGSVQNSYHPIGRALDIAPPNWASEEGNRAGWFLAHWYQVNATRLGIEQIIWDNWIWQSGSWRPYWHPSGSDPSLNHENHVHVSTYVDSGVPNAPLLNHSPHSGTARVPFRAADSVLTP